jgi:hypothetical protein
MLHAASERQSESRMTTAFIATPDPRVSHKVRVIWRSAAPAAMGEAALSISCKAALASSEELESKASASIPGLDPCKFRNKIHHPFHLHKGEFFIRILSTSACRLTDLL